MEHFSDQYDDDFPYPHLDPPELADGPIEPGFDPTSGVPF